ncbi:hypothetical protein Dimus_020452 [Dionaea muscipula]
MRDVVDVVDDNLKDDTPIGASRDEMDDEVKVVENPIGDAHLEATRDVDVAENPMDDAPLEVFRDDADKQGIELVVFIGFPTTQAKIENLDIHEYIKQAVKCILNAMEEQNQGIIALCQHLESKIFTDNQKENLLFVRLDKIKTYVRNLSITIKQTLLSIIDVVSREGKSLSETNQT